MIPGNFGFTDEHIELVRPALRKIALEGDVDLATVEGAIMKFIEGGWDAITDDEARLISRCPEALRRINSMFIEASNEEEWLVDDAVQLLAAAEHSDGPFLVFQWVEFKLWGYPKETPDSKQLVVLEVIKNDALKDNTYVAVIDANGYCVMEGELISGELSAAIDSLHKFSMPFKVKYRSILKS